MQDGYDQTLSGLLRKRAEVAGETVSMRDALDAKLSTLDTLDAAIRIFNPNIEDAELPERRAPIAHADATSEIRRFLIDQMRAADPRPVRTMDVVATILEQRGIDPRDRIVCNLIRKRVTDAFGRMRKIGMVEGRRFGSGSECEWRLIG